MAPRPSSSPQPVVTRVDTDPEGYEFINGNPVMDGNVCGFSISVFNATLGGDIVWKNCCDAKNVNSCATQMEGLKKCPTGYHSCADVLHHPAMCALGTSGYSDKNSHDKKCCPKDYTCGPFFESPCQRLVGNIEDSKPQVKNEFVLPQYASAPGIFNGCDHNLMPAATIGGITAAGIVTFCIVVGVVLCLLRRRIYRDPRRVARRRLISRLIDRHLLNNPGSKEYSADANLQIKKGLFFDEPPESPPPAVVRRSDSRTNKMAPQELNFEGITVTKEITVQTIEEGDEMKEVHGSHAMNSSDDSISTIEEVPARRLDPAGETWFEAEQEKQAKRAKLFANQRF